MYPFNIEQTEDKSYRFELNGINMIIDGFVLKEEVHYLLHPDKAIAFFTVDGNLYGVVNRAQYCDTVEGFYEIMCKQYQYFH